MKNIRTLFLMAATILASPLNDLSLNAQPATVALGIAPVGGQSVLYWPEKWSNYVLSERRTSFRRIG